MAWNPPEEHSAGSRCQQAPPGSWWNLLRGPWSWARLLLLKSLIWMGMITHKDQCLTCWVGILYQPCVPGMQWCVTCSQTCHIWVLSACVWICECPTRDVAQTSQTPTLVRWSPVLDSRPSWCGPSAFTGDLSSPRFQPQHWHLNFLNLVPLAGTSCASGWWDHWLWPVSRE